MYVRVNAAYRNNSRSNYLDPAKNFDGMSLIIELDGTRFIMDKPELSLWYVLTVDRHTGAASPGEIRVCQTDQAFADMVVDLPIGALAVVFRRGGVATDPAGDAARRAAQLLGGALIHEVGAGQTWLLAGRKGAAPGSQPESLVGALENCPVRLEFTRAEPVARSAAAIQLTAFSGLAGTKDAHLTVVRAGKQVTRHVLTRSGRRRAGTIAVVAVEARYLDDDPSPATPKVHQVTGHAELAKILRPASEDTIFMLALDGGAERLDDETIALLQSLGSSIRAEDGVLWSDSVALIGGKGWWAGSAIERRAARMTVSVLLEYDPTARRFAPQGAARDYSLNVTSRTQWEEGERHLPGVAVAIDETSLLGPDDVRVSGFLVVRLEEATGRELARESYDLYDAAQADAFARQVERLTAGSLLVVVKGDRPTRGVELGDGAKRALAMLGGHDFPHAEDPYVLVGRKGDPRPLCERRQAGGGVVRARHLFVPTALHQIDLVLDPQADEGGGKPHRMLLDGQQRPELRGGICVALYQERDLSPIESRLFPGYESEEEIDQIAEYIEGIPYERFFVFTVSGRAAHFLPFVFTVPSVKARKSSVRLARALAELGASRIENNNGSGVYMLIGRKRDYLCEPLHEQAYDESIRVMYLADPLLPGAGFHRRISVSCGEFKNIRVGESLILDSVYDDRFAVVVVDPATGHVVDRCIIPVAEPDADAAFPAYIRRVPVGSWVAVALTIERELLSDESRRALQSIGSARALTPLNKSTSLAIVGRKGAAPGSVPEQHGECKVIASAPLPVSPAAGPPTYQVMTATSRGKNTDDRNDAAELTVGHFRFDNTSGTGRGVNVVVSDDAGNIEHEGHYDTHRDSPREAPAMVEHLENLPGERYVLLAARDEMSANLGDAKDLLTKRLGSEHVRSVGWRGAWSMICRTRKSAGPGGAVTFERMVETPVTRSERAARSVYWVASGLAPELASKLVTFSITSSAGKVQFRKDAQTLLTATEPGLHVVRLSEDGATRTGTTVSCTRFPTADDHGAAFAAFVESLPPGDMVLVGACGHNQLATRAIRACASLGSAESFHFAAGSAWCLVGVKGAAPGAVPECFHSDGAAACSLTVPTQGHGRLLSPLIVGSWIVFIGLHFLIGFVSQRYIPRPGTPTSPARDQTSPTRAAPVVAPKKTQEEVLNVIVVKRLFIGLEYPGQPASLARSIPVFSLQEVSRTLASDAALYFEKVFKTRVVVENLGRELYDAETTVRAKLADEDYATKDNVLEALDWFAKNKEIDALANDLVTHDDWKEIKARLTSFEAATGSIRTVTEHDKQSLKDIRLRVRFHHILYLHYAGHGNPAISPGEGPLLALHSKRDSPYNVPLTARELHVRLQEIRERVRNFVSIFDACYAEDFLHAWVSANARTVVLTGSARDTPLLPIDGDVDSDNTVPPFACYVRRALDFRSRLSTYEDICDQIRAAMLEKVDAKRRYMVTSLANLVDKAGSEAMRIAATIKALDYRRHLLTNGKLPIYRHDPALVPPGTPFLKPV